MTRFENSPNHLFEFKTTLDEWYQTYSNNWYGKKTPSKELQKYNNEGVVDTWISYPWALKNKNII